MSQEESVDVKAAKEILDGRSAELPEIFTLVPKLKTQKEFGLARKLLTSAARDILSQSCEDISTTKNQETLGITGAIYKRKWELNNQKSLLERALNYYLR